MSLQTASSLSSLALFDTSLNLSSSTSSPENRIDDFFGQLLTMADEFEKGKTIETAGLPSAETRATPSPLSYKASLPNSTHSSPSSAGSSPDALVLPPNLQMLALKTSVSSNASDDGVSLHLTGSLAVPLATTSPPLSDSLLFGLAQPPPSQSSSPASSFLFQPQSHSVSPTTTPSPLTHPPSATPTASESMVYGWQPPSGFETVDVEVPGMDEFRHRQSLARAQAQYNLESAALAQALRIQEHLETLRQLGFHAELTPLPMPTTGVPSVAYAVAHHHQQRQQLMGPGVPPVKTPITFRYEAPRRRGEPVHPERETNWVPPRGRARAGGAKRARKNDEEESKGRKRFRL